MQTIYYTTANFVRRGNIVDLEDYRRRLALTQEGSLAPRPREDLSPWEEAAGPEEARAGEYEAAPGEDAPRLCTLRPRADSPIMRRERRERCALLLDMWASVGVLAMTLAFLAYLVLG